MKTVEIKAITALEKDELTKEIEVSLKQYEVLHAKLLELYDVQHGPDGGIALQRCAAQKAMAEHTGSAEEWVKLRDKFLQINEKWNANEKEIKEVNNKIDELVTGGEHIDQRLKLGAELALLDKYGIQGIVTELNIEKDRIQITFPEYKTLSIYLDHGYDTLEYEWTTYKEFIYV